jgi:hypothetical protein
MVNRAVDLSELGSRVAATWRSAAMLNFTDISVRGKVQVVVEPFLEFVAIA